MVSSRSTGAETSDCPKRQRKICAEYLHFNDDGTIQPVVRTAAGVGPSQAGGL